MKPPRWLTFGSGFSALQRAENSSIVRSSSISTTSEPRFQCSSASRKFLNVVGVWVADALVDAVSVLFSEPKIPQLNVDRPVLTLEDGFSALQRAENSSIIAQSTISYYCQRVSVLFSEPKIPQSRPSHLRPSIFPTAMITLRHS